MWRQPTTACAASNIQETIPFGGGAVIVWERVSHEFKFDLVTVQGNLNGPRYKTGILKTVVDPHFDNHSFATRRDQRLLTTMLYPIERVQWWISYSEIQSLPFLGQHEAPTSIQLRTCGTYCVDHYVRDILQSNI